MEYDPAAFNASASEERIAKCRAFADEAESLAQAARDATRDGYLSLAKEWMKLAAEMEAAEDEKSNARGVNELSR